MISTGPSGGGPSPRRRAATRAVSTRDAGRAAARAPATGCSRRSAEAVQAGAPTIGRRSSVAAGPARSTLALLPTISPMLRAPSAASSARTSSAMAVAKRATCSGVPVNFARRSSRWVAMPVGQVSRWHCRAMSQPIATRSAVPNPNSSAPEQRGDDDVTAGLEPAVGPDDDPVAEPAPHQRLVGLGQPELPGRADVLDRRQRRGAGPTRVAGDVDVVGAGLGHAGRDRADAAAGDELDADPGGRIDRPQVRDELGEVLDRVDVVVGRGTDERLAGLGAPERRDVGGRLATGQLAALAGLAALGDLDLELVGVDEVVGGHAEAGRGDLLDPGVTALAARRRRRAPDPRRPRRCWRRRRRAGCRA